MVKEDLNLPDEMVVPALAWVITRVVNPNTSCPILMISGRAGSAKTTTARRLKDLLDPSPVSESSLSNDETVMALRLSTRESIIWDNVTSIRQSVSDFLCRAVTGGAYEGRKLYTNSDISTMDFMRSQIITCVDTPSLKEDLRTRTVFISAPTLGGKYISEKELNRRWNENVASYRGAIMTLISLVKQKEIEVGNTIKSPERLSDYFRTVRLIDLVLEENAMKFSEVDGVNAIQNSNKALASDAIPDIVEFMIDCENVIELKGSASKVLTQLRDIANAINYPTKLWGSTGRWMAIVLRENISALSEHFDIQETTYNNRGTWVITRKEYESIEELIGESI